MSFERKKERHKGRETMKQKTFGQKKGKRSLCFQGIKREEGRAKKAGEKKMVTWKVIEKDRTRNKKNKEKKKPFTLFSRW